MKLGWIIDGPLDRRTGGTIYDSIVVEGLRARGVTVDVHVVRRSGACALVRQLVRTAPDAVIGDELSFAALDLVFEHATFTRRILLVHHLTCWEDELHERVRRRIRHLEARVLRRSDRVIVTSRTTRDRLMREGCRASIAVVPPGADRLELFPRSPSDGPNVLFVGAVTRRKRVLELVRAFAAADPHACLTIVGSREHDVDYARDVDAAIATQSRRIRCLGEVAESELARQFAQADVLVLASSLEGYGIAATEAVRSGVPVIAARTAGLVEALTPCPEATIFVEGPEALASAIRDVTSNRTLRATLRNAAARAGPTLPSWQGSVDAFHAIVNH